MATRRPTIGECRDWIRIERDNDTSDTIGGQTPTPATLIRTAAKVTPLTGRERYAAQSVKASLAYLVELPYPKGTTVLASDRVILEASNTTLQIVSPPIDLEARRTWLQLECADSR